MSFYILHVASPNATHTRSPATPSSPLVPPATLPSSALNENDKKVRNIEKKLRQIADLKERQANGEKLELTQVIEGRLCFGYMNEGRLIHVTNPDPLGLGDAECTDSKDTGRSCAPEGTRTIEVTVMCKSIKCFL